MLEASKGSAAKLRREAARARLLAHNAADAEEREKLTAMAAMYDREAKVIDAALNGRS